MKEKWEIFKNSGKVEDYLEYVKEKEKSDNKN